MSQRQKFVYFDGSQSELQCVTVNKWHLKGVALGLSCTRFLSDFPLALERAHISMYADDSIIYLAGTNIYDLNVHLDHELKFVMD